ncbi:Rpn family recombination-promoting nuclease/putative transposase [Desulfoscipio sp. XC116]|uniref:Rpn family recombination-promoting nuclease/putative transposase n=1 Tax=Desulfoscipio sp. XC116 TaxID=3144975 RepID=UPI00325AB32B
MTAEQPKDLLSPLIDLVFKALFAREEPRSRIILIDLLNSLLGLQGDNKITSITHLNPFNYKEYPGDKSSILDIKVMTHAKERINIEVQVNDVDNFRKRSLYYWARMYSETIAESEAYTTLKKSIVINILDFDIIHETDRYHTQYRILEKDDGFLLVEDLEIHYFELKKFIDQTPPGEMDAVEYWLTFMKNAGKPDGKELLQKLAEEKEELAMAMDILAEISADERLRQKAYAQEKARLDAISRIKYAELKGIEKGIGKGRIEGKIEGRIEGKAELLIKQISKRFGSLPKDLQVLVMNADDAVLDAIGEEIFDLQSPDDILKFLN